MPAKFEGASVSDQVLRERITMGERIASAFNFLGDPHHSCEEGEGGWKKETFKQMVEELNGACKATIELGEMFVREWKKAEALGPYDRVEQLGNMEAKHPVKEAEGYREQVARAQSFQQAYKAALLAYSQAYNEVFETGILSNLNDFKDIRDPVESAIKFGHPHDIEVNITQLLHQRKTEEN